MKLGKAKLIFSIVSLVAAFALAAFTAYAWFLSFTDVSTSGIDSLITSGDVLSFDIDYYYTESEDGTHFTIGDKVLPDNQDEGRRNMPDHKPSLESNGSTQTAVLLDMRLTFSKSGEFVMDAKTRSTDVYASVFLNYISKNYLSNVVYIRDLDKDDVNFQSKEFTVSMNAKEHDFITRDGGTSYFDGDRDDLKKNPSFQLITYTVAEDATGAANEHHIYFLIDYMSQQINSMYSIMLRLFPKDADLNTRIKFLNDIFFVIGRPNK